MPKIPAKWMRIDPLPDLRLPSPFTRVKPASAENISDPCPKSAQNWFRDFPLSEAKLELKGSLGGTFSQEDLELVNLQSSDAHQKLSKAECSASGDTTTVKLFASGICGLASVGNKDVGCLSRSPSALLSPFLVGRVPLLR